MSALDKLYGISLLYPTRQESIFNSIKYEWNLTKFHKDLHRAYKSILSEMRIVDSISLIQRMREHGTFDKSYIVRVSDLTTIASSGELSQVGSLLMELEWSEKERSAQILLSSLSGALNDGTFTPEKYLEILEKAKESGAIESRTEMSNVEAVFEVIERHNRAKKGEISGIRLGLRDLHRVVLLEPVDFMVIGARPAMGKTALAVSLAVNFAFDQGLKVALFCLEMSIEQMMRRVVSNVAGVDSNRIKYGECGDWELKKIEAVQTTPQLNNIHLFEGARTVDEITREVSRLISSSGCDVVIVDYLQKITPRDRRRARHEQVADNSNGLKLLSQNLKVPTISMAQVGRDVTNRGGDMRPRLSDLRDSGEIEQDASIVAFIHRPEYYGITIDENGESTEGLAELIIAKNREGAVGIYPLKVSLKTSKFYDIPYDKRTLSPDELSGMRVVPISQLGVNEFEKEGDEEVPF